MCIMVGLHGMVWTPKGRVYAPKSNRRAPVDLRPYFVQSKAEECGVAPKAAAVKSGKRGLAIVRAGNVSNR
ncbi:hypothetical protein D3C85_1685140 [compost metagenome]